MLNIRRTLISVASAVAVATVLSAMAAPATAATTPSVRVSTFQMVNGHPVISVANGRGVRALAGGGSAVTSTVDSRAQATAVNDPLRSFQWALDYLKADTLQALHDASDVTVAVIDSGVQGSHPDLASVLVSDGTDFVKPGGNGTADGNGHGTHVAGIIAAVAGNGVGTVGLAKGAKILPIRVLDDNASGWNSDIAKGIVYAADHGAQVINLSLSSTSKDSVLNAAVQYARSKNVLVVASAGNSRLTGSPIAYPAAFPGVLAVGATDSHGVSAPFSTTGAYVGISAPGVNVLSTYKGSNWTTMSGTSMAAPYVAAAAAVIKSAKSTLAADQISAALTNTAFDKGVPGRDNEYGAGIVQPAVALCSVVTCEGLPQTNKRQTTLTVTPVSASVAMGASVPKISVKGTLKTDGQPLAITAVDVCTNTAVNVVACVTVKTAKTGAFSTSVPMPGRGTVWVSYAGAFSYDAARSVDMPVNVLPTLTVSAGKGTLSSTVKPARGQSWVLQKSTSDGWSDVTSSVLAANAPSGSVSLTKLTPGQYRVVVQETDLLSQVISKTVSVR